MILSGSLWRKALVTALAVGGFVWLYEVTMLDSRDVRRQASAEVIEHPEPGARLSFTATAYCKGTVTASGVAAQAGVAAADPKLLPAGSIVEVQAVDRQHDGIYSVLDTGPAVRGAILDIYIWSCHEALRFGRQPVLVRVLRLGWTPGATAPGLLERLMRLVGPVSSASSLPSRPPSTSVQ